MWWAQIDDLSRDFTVYAIDMPGQPGAGVQTRKMATRADAARCVDLPKASHCVQAEVPEEINACIREFANLHAPPS